jgi:biopolymer transport protein ExbB
MKIRTRSAYLFAMACVAGGLFAGIPGAYAQTPTPPAATAPAPAIAAPQSAATPAPQAQTPPLIAAPAPAVPGEIENPYSLTALWQGGDFVARGTIVILVIMSMGTWYVMITKFIEQMALMRQAREAERRFWNADGIGEGARLLGKRSAFRMLVEDGLGAVSHHEGKLTEQIDRHTWITMSLQRSVDSINNRLQTGLALLATVGSTAPFVGLFGTVWGIYHALTAIGIAGQASIDKVAGPVGEALIMTAIGLAVAVPAVLAYNWMVRRNKIAMDRVRNFSGDLLALLIGGARSGTKPAARSA